MKTRKITLEIPAEFRIGQAMHWVANEVAKEIKPDIDIFYLSDDELLETLKDNINE